MPKQRFFSVLVVVDAIPVSNLISDGSGKHVGVKITVAGQKREDNQILT